MFVHSNGEIRINGWNDLINLLFARQDLNVDFGSTILMTTIKLGSIVLKLNLLLQDKIFRWILIIHDNAVIMNPIPMFDIFISFNFFSFFNALLLQLLFRIDKDLDVSFLIFLILNTLLKFLFDYILSQANELRLVIFDEHSVTITSVWNGCKKFEILKFGIVCMIKYCFVRIIVLYELQDVAKITHVCMCNNFFIVFMFFRLKTSYTWTFLFKLNNSTHEIFHELNSGLICIEVSIFYKCDVWCALAGNHISFIFFQTIKCLIYFKIKNVFPYF